MGVEGQMSAPPCVFTAVPFTVLQEHKGSRTYEKSSVFKLVDNSGFKWEEL